MKAINLKLAASKKRKFFKLVALIGGNRRANQYASLLFSIKDNAKDLLYYLLPSNITMWGRDEKVVSGEVLSNFPSH